MSTSTEDEIGGEFDRMVRSALMGIMMTSETVARVRESRNRDEASAAEQAAREARDLARASEQERREHSRAVNARIRRPEFWRNAGVDQVDDLVAYSAALVAIDATELGTKEIVAEQLSTRFGLEVDQVSALDPHRRHEVIAEAFEQTADARFAMDNPDVSRTLYDRLRRREYWDQAAPGQVADVAELTVRLAPHDTRAAEADAALVEQLKNRYDIDLNQIRAAHADPVTRAGALATELAEAARARDVAANRDETRLVYDRVRRPEFWNQATPEQIADVVKYTHQVAPYDLTGRESAQIVAEQLRKKFKIDLDEVNKTSPNDPEARRKALIEALDDQVAFSRENTPESEPLPADGAVPAVPGEQASPEALVAPSDLRASVAGVVDVEPQDAGASATLLGEAQSQRAAAEGESDLADRDVIDAERELAELETGAPEAGEHAQHAADLETSAAGHEAQAEAFDAAATRTEAAGAGASQGYQRVTDAELAQVPPVPAGARKQAATSFPRSTASGLRTSAAGRSKKPAAAKVTRAQGRQAERGQELGK